VAYRGDALHPRSTGGNPRALLSGSPTPDAGKKTAFRLYGTASRLTWNVARMTVCE